MREKQNLTQAELAAIRCCKQLIRDILNTIVQKSTNLEKMYGEYRATLKGKAINDNEVENILRTSTNNKELEEVWKSHKGIGRVVEKEMLEVVKILSL